MSNTENKSLCTYSRKTFRKYIFHWIKSEVYTFNGSYVFSSVVTQYRPLTGLFP